MCRVLEVSTSRYYDWVKRSPGDRAASNRVLDEHIQSVFHQHKGRYGSPRLVDELNDNGIRCSENRVARRMQALGLQAIQAKKFKVTTDSNHDWPVAANLLQQDFTAEEPNHKWVSDITYSVPGVQGKHGCLNELQVYLKYTNKTAGDSLFASMPGCAGMRV